jgi:plasmid rolling circle replication initiator protein Rep
MSKIIAENLDVVEVDTGEILTDIGRNGKERPWKSHKEEGLRLDNLFVMAKKLDDSVITDNGLKSLEECGDTLIFVRNEKGEKRLHGANFCRNRLCPMCNWRRSLKMYSQVSQITDKILATRKSRFVFVTLTVRNPDGEHLAKTLDLMNKGFSYITSNSRTFAPAKKFKESLQGYIKATEITYNSEGNTYHPHIHCIFQVRPSYFKGTGYIKKSDWVELWQKAMSLDYAPSVYVKTIKETDNDKTKAVAEVAKYPTKSADLLKIENEEQAVQALIVLAKTMKGRRLITFGGDFAMVKRELKLDDIETGDLIHAEQEAQNFNPVAKMIYRWRAEVGAYIC